MELIESTDEGTTDGTALESTDAVLLETVVDEADELTDAINIWALEDDPLCIDDETLLVGVIAV